MKKKTKKGKGKRRGNSRMLVIYEFKKSGAFSLRPTKSGYRVLGLKPQKHPHKLPPTINDAELGRWVRRRLDQCDY